jgi:hypothetical protein
MSFFRVSEGNARLRPPEPLSSRPDALRQILLAAPEKFFCAAGNKSAAWKDYPFGEAGRIGSLSVNSAWDIITKSIDGATTSWRAGGGRGTRSSAPCRPSADRSSQRGRLSSRSSAPARPWPRPGPCRRQLTPLKCRPKGTEVPMRRAAVVARAAAMAKFPVCTPRI